MKHSYRYRLYPSKVQSEFLSKQFGCGRFVWNSFLEYCSSDKNIKINNTLFSRLTEIKKLPDYSFLNEVSAVGLQQSLIDLVTAYRRFFTGISSRPVFKSKYGRQSFRIVGETNTLDIRHGRLFIPRCPGLLKIKMHREMPSVPKSVTISKLQNGHYYASFVCDVNETNDPVDQTVGVDLGIKDFAILSNGVKVPNPKHLIKMQKRLARSQRKLSRKQKGSNNRNKQRIKVAELYQTVANQRKDFLHKLSTKLINENQVICLEDLNVKGMIRNRKLAKHIGDASWGSFRTMLGYKAQRHTRQLVLLDKFTPSTQTCHVCMIQRKIPLALRDRSWKCDCGAMHDRDINAAKIIHHIGMTFWSDNPHNRATLMIAPRWKNGSFLV